MSTAAAPQIIKTRLMDRYERQAFVAVEKPRQRLGFVAAPPLKPTAPTSAGGLTPAEVAKLTAQGVFRPTGQPATAGLEPLLNGVEVVTVPGIGMGFLRVTPAIAARWLRQNQGNRNLRSSTVDSYARDMAAEEWLLNHQGVAFDQAGVLFDGQHRLSAVVQSGATVILLVSWGWPRRVEGKRVKTMQTLDCGARRSLGDMLRLDHATENPRVVTAAARIIAMICPDMKKNRVGKMSMSAHLLIAGEFSGGLKFMAEHAPKQLGLRRAEVLGVLAMAHGHAPARVAEFTARLASGAGLDAGNPLLPLRNYLLGDAWRKENGVLQMAKAVATHLRRWLAGEQSDRLERADDALAWLRGLNPAGTSQVAALFALKPKAP